MHVTMVFECYLFNQLLHCISMAYIVRNDDVSFARVNKRIILPVGRPVSMQAQCLHGLPVLT